MGHCTVYLYNSLNEVIYCFVINYRKWYIIRTVSHVHITTKQCKVCLVQDHLFNVTYGTLLYEVYIC